MAAKRGVDSAQYNLGDMYFNGEGVDQDYTKAFEWYEMAAKQGHFLSQLRLGKMYSNGEGVRKNTVIAKEWFSKVCDSGIYMGCEEYQILNQK